MSDTEPNRDDESLLLGGESFSVRAEDGQIDAPTKTLTFVLLLVMVGTFACGGFDTITNEKRYDGGATYLTSEGLGYCAWLVWTFGTLVPRFASFFLVFTLLKSFSSKGLVESRLQLVFGDMAFSDKSLRAAKFTFKLARALFNPAMIAWRFIGLPPRDPGEPLNQAKHIVAWYELVGIFKWLSIVFGVFGRNFPNAHGLMGLLSLVTWLGSVVYFLCSHAPGHFLVVFAAYVFIFFGFVTARAKIHGLSRTIDATARFSVLNSLSFFSINSLQSYFNSLQRFGPMKFLIMVGTVPLLCAFAGMSLLVKLAQLDYAVNKLYWDWSALEWLNLLAFTNNIAGIMDLEKIARFGIFAQLRQDDELTDHTTETIAESWMNDFGEKLAKIWGGPIAVFILATATPADIAAVLKD